MSPSDHPGSRQTLRCGEYRIELAAPRLWVVTRERMRFSGRPKVQVEATTGSLTTANGIVAKLHRKHCVERSLRAHLVALVVVFGVAALASSAVPSLVMPAVVLTTLFALRVLLRTVDLLTGRSWEQVSSTYQ